MQDGSFFRKYDTIVGDSKQLLSSPANGEQSEMGSVKYPFIPFGFLIMYNTIPLHLPSPVMVSIVMNSQVNSK